MYFYLQNPTEITLLGRGELYDFVTKKFLPESIIVAVSNPAQLKNLSSYVFFAGKQFQDKTAFVCKNFSCSLPLRSVSDIEKLLS
jgi:uncharacterized protein YyaL (SSP411 family)